LNRKEIPILFDPAPIGQMPSFLAWWIAWLLVAAPAATAGTLVVNANSADPAPRAAWEAVVRHFEREHPDVRVRFNVYDHESYKQAIRNWLTGASPDVVFWFAGHRMRQFAVPGLLEDVSDLFDARARASLHPSALELASAHGRQYGVPYTSYPVGLYVRRDLLEAVGVKALRTWSELLDACVRLRGAGLEPFAIGTRDLWPAAAWFDYLNLRLHGLAFHQSLMQGRVAYTDARVREVFAHWRELLVRRCFSANHASSSWQESQALLYDGRAAAMLIGHFIVPNFPAAVRDRIDFVAFPQVRAGVGRYEDAPMNTIHIPARAANKADARRFLAFVLRPDVQEALNRATLQIPVHREAKPASDRFVEAGLDHLRTADGYAQYFDRDTNEELANVAMKGFQEFMLHPDRVDAILDGIERARSRIYGPVAAAATSR
jgi:multiple sugar transport system substrate-binding protein